MEVHKVDLPSRGKRIQYYWYDTNIYGCPRGFARRECAHATGPGLTNGNRRMPPCSYPTKRLRTTIRICSRRRPRNGRRPRSCGSSISCRRPKLQGLDAARVAGAQPGRHRARTQAGAAGDAAARRGLHRLAAKNCSISIAAKATPATLGRMLELGGAHARGVDRFVVLGIGGSYMGARALFEALRSSYHNDLPAKDRAGTPAHLFRRQQRRQRFAARAVRDAVDHLHRSRSPRGTLGRHRHQQIGRHAGDRRRLSGDSPRDGRVLRQPFAALEEPGRADHRRDRQAARLVQGRRLSRREHPDDSPTTSAAAIRCSRRSACCPRRSWGSMCAPCCSAPRP